MPQFTDLRAVSRHGPGFLTARDVMSVAMIVADADGRSGEDGAERVIETLGALPGLEGLDRDAIRVAGQQASEGIARKGVEAVFSDAAERMDARTANAAILLACRVAMTDGEISADGDAVLRPMARRLGIGRSRLEAIRVLAARREAHGETRS
ncbi:tellurite resistance TerB family protein [Jannaschia seohaensis]|uniref:Tellurite resistance protein n=1 Tax=Jannaschia seohaensis TaxID=475081 RepID=A0A2Y9AGR0_9RHOB|nr:tellurite resistance TerB family protein [Jannaschia seohaensis]PWJ21147.1 tellurite resistance protein [Jannaschia seohaensis]SSA41557.1 Tellurite resistance protein [Jannaschia seohaensis]